MSVRLTSMSVIWKKTLEILQKSINPAHVRAWLIPLQSSLDDNGLTLTASNGFVVSWVKSRYLEAIEHAVRQVSTRDVRVRIVSASNGDRRTECSAPQRMQQHTLPMSMTPQLPVVHVSPAAAENGGPAGTSLPGGFAGCKTGSANATGWRFSFQDFVVGPSNELAFSAARSICRQQLVTDQFYICSAPGLGKTHLLQAIGRELAEKGGRNRSKVRLAYLSAEDFACRMVMALKRREMETFKAGFREGADVLLLEDVHFLQGKEKTQEELLATIKSMRSMGKQVIFTSSFLPRELPKLDGQLASQFCDGFMAVIEKPDFETRMRILEAKAKVFQVQIPQDVNELFANSIPNDIRLLENCLQNLVIKARLMNQRISHGLALEILRNYAPSAARPDLESIIAFVCRSFNLSHEALRTKSRKKENVLARNTIFFLARKHTEMSLKDIGEAFNRKHSTVIKGITTVEREMSLQSQVGRQMDHLVQTLEAQSSPGASSSRVITH
ncbi:chromosomal replication initiator protein [Desulfonatronum thiosulfatophilum]|uniref:Chromosomal replication initiator protein DnaA n=1 Tax=Desulfonatronum thiosulfatophilum TaxID=617002 RepID=A0A1G6BPM4_9BACT|nr:DnaA/Hda family protein [Desulfonatronum thiosulfatophilum]SDB22604.1 chromosomal replication initiator protein [Desulfonatronum thiosulfatophilum]